MMTVVIFDARVPANRQVGFDVPSNVPGATISCTVTVTAPGTPGHPGGLLALFSFGTPIPANRHVTFTCPTTVPVGAAHFTVLITTASPTVAVYQVATTKPKARPKRKAPKKNPGRR